MKKLISILLCAMLIIPVLSVVNASAISGKTYYLFGYINGANYACEEDYRNMGEYKFENGMLIANFNMVSYVAVKEENNTNWYMTNGWAGEVSSAELYNTSITGENSNKLKVPAGVDVTFTLVENNDGSLTLSYQVAEQFEGQYRNELWDEVYIMSSDLYPENYTEDSYKEFKKALEEAETVLENLNSTDEELIKAKNNLISAKNNLVTAEFKPTESVTTESTQPITDKPTEPITTKPTESSTDKPTEPSTTESTEPITNKPTEPITTKPTESSTDKPTEPATTESTEPIIDKPTEPVTTTPTEASTDKPTEPVTTNPTESSTDKPTEPVTTEPAITEPPTDKQTEPATTEPIVINPQPTENKPTTPAIVKPTVKKKANPVKVTVKTRTVKLKKLKKKAQKVKPITVKKAQGKVSYKVIKSGVSKKIRKLVSINKKGTITIYKWKKAKKGTYKIKVKIIAKGNSKYYSKTLNKTVKIKIK